jgi:ABC-2 type transport system ATP-binding protein
MTAVISVSGPVKNFGTTRALDHLELTVSAGEVPGFLCPNDAGKTTTIRVLLGLPRRDGPAGRTRLSTGSSRTPTGTAGSCRRRC